MARLTQCSTPDVEVHEVVLAVKDNLGEGPPPAQLFFHVRNPSARLHLTLEIFFRPDAPTADGVHAYAGETWQLFAAADGVNPEIALNFVFDNGGSPPVRVDQPLPNSWEVESGIKAIQGIVVAAAVVGASGSYVVRATWEQAVGETMTEATLARLFARANLTTANPPPHFA
jgi:hypothetical protein